MCGNNLWIFLSYLFWSNFVKTAMEAFLYSNFIRISTMKHKSVSFMLVLSICLHHFNLDVNLCYGCSSWIGKSFSSHLAALLISTRFCSLSGRTLLTQHEFWQGNLLQLRLPWSTIPDPGAPGNVPSSYTTHSNAQ